MKKTKLVKEDWKAIIVDILTLQEFAKRFWGEDIIEPDDWDNDLLEWQYHLGRIVTAKDPLKELKKYYSGPLGPKKSIKKHR